MVRLRVRRKPIDPRAGMISSQFQRKLAICAVVLAVASGASIGAAHDELRLESSAPSIVWIAGGWFYRGSDRPDLDAAIELCLRHASQQFCFPELVTAFIVSEYPRQRVFVGPYGIDRTEVTNAAWQRCVHAGACPPSRLLSHVVAAPELPVAGVTWSEAAHYCRGIGARLPTEAEWEYAARGDSLRSFPWGHVYNDRATNHGTFRFEPDPIDGHEYAAPVGAFPSDASAFGVLDMAGNVSEWTSDFHAFERDPEAVNPAGPAEGAERVVRGGSWIAPPYAARVTYRQSQGADLAEPFLGFRCAYDVH